MKESVLASNGLKLELTICNETKQEPSQNKRITQTATQTMSKTYDNYPTVLLAEPIGAPKNVRTTNLTLPEHQNAVIDEKQIGQLIEQGYSRGLAESLNKNKSAFGQRVS